MKGKKKKDHKFVFMKGLPSILPNNVGLPMIKRTTRKNGNGVDNLPCTCTHDAGVMCELDRHEEPKSDLRQV